jgi:hypothetical protein
MATPQITVLFTCVSMTFVPNFTPEMELLKLKKAIILNQGSDVTISPLPDTWFGKLQKL